MERWEYGKLFTVYPQFFGGERKDPVCVFQTRSGERVMPNLGLATFDELGSDGWIIDAPGPLMANPPDWLTTMAYGPADRVLSAQWSVQHSRRRVG